MLRFRCSPPPVSAFAMGPKSARTRTMRPSAGFAARRRKKEPLRVEVPQRDRGRVDGRAQLVSTEALEKTFAAAGASTQLVVLSACYSEVQAQALLPHVG